MSNKKSIHPFLLAALGLGLGGEGLYAQTAVRGKVGLSASDLSRVVEDLEIRQDGQKLTFAGFIPRRCAANAETKSEFKDGNHYLTIRLPACESGFSKTPGEPMDDAADILAPVLLQDFSGKVFLRHSTGKSRNAANPFNDEPLNIGDKQIAIVGSDTLLAEQARQTQAEARARDKAEASALQSRLLNLCKKGDFAGLRAELEASGLSILPGIFEKLDLGEQKKFLKDLQKAADAQDAATIFEAYQTAAAERGWDDQALNKSYMEKRLDILKSRAEEAKSGEVQLSVVATEIKEWSSELKEMDPSAFKKSKADFAELFAELGTHAANKKKLPEAERYFAQAARLSDEEGKLKINGALAKFYMEQFKACAKKNPAAMDRCERQFANKAREKADTIGEALASSGEEEAQQQLAAFQVEYAQTFGAGLSLQYPGFGTYSQQPGALQQFKIQTLQEYQIQQQLLQQQAWLQRIYGNQYNSAAATPGSSFLR